ncbi:putative orfan [Tupanvirus soda lake]|uniref:Orfan n=2 Tax=Tupanvirus TaxID=2094720 RepID=A0AC62AD75_9VIRU|nr:putative orfan [Tupanvirus soda lake]QKU35701.1 putative orfan [Tupanvirus soda lake]
MSTYFVCDPHKKNSTIMNHNNQVVLSDCRAICQEAGCSNSVFVKYFKGQYNDFRCPLCLSMPCVINATSVPAGHYTSCSACKSYFKCLADYKGTKPLCPMCRPSKQSPRCKFQANKQSGPRCKDCGTTTNITFGPDPYQHEIHDDKTPFWMCDSCRYEAYMDT